MKDQENCIELRLACVGHACIYVLGLWCPQRGLTRLRNQFLDRYEPLPHGGFEAVHLLPCWNLIHEVHEVRQGERLTWYAATIEDDPKLYRISRQGAEAFAKRQMSIREVVKKFPERPLFEVEWVR